LQIRQLQLFARASQLKTPSQTRVGGLEEVADLRRWHGNWPAGNVPTPMRVRDRLEAWCKPNFMRLGQLSIEAMLGNDTTWRLRLKDEILIGNVQDSVQLQVLFVQRSAHAEAGWINDAHALLIAGGDQWDAQLIGLFEQWPEQFRGILIQKQPVFIDFELQLGIAAGHRGKTGKPVVLGTQQVPAVS